ncbi:YidC/Oxa1 family membrane protein insertase [Patescibacteria group bacterium]|nr:YidC/Oxa1 family membrane protein insertase [Patescibacteria group bacterium]
MNLLIAPFVNALFGFYYLVGNLGWSVVIVTVLLRILLFPLVLPSLKSAKVMRKIAPRMKKLQEKFKDDKQKLAAAQMELYKEYGINPMSGCLPQLLQIVVLILFFSAFNLVTNFSHGKGTMAEVNSQLLPFLQVHDGFKFDLSFMGSNLGMTPAAAFASKSMVAMLLPIVLLVGSAIAQYLSARLMMPAQAKGINEAAATKATEDKEDDMMAAMRTQSLYFMPLMTLVIGWNFSLGILLYWFVNSVVMIGQQVVGERLNKEI